ncbi:hypothetical protein L9F63_026954, partial [Diploptera punctata]
TPDVEMVTMVADIAVLRLKKHRSPRPGLCPHIRLLPAHMTEEVDRPIDPPSLCGNLCTHDYACPIGKKCCPTTCGYSCYDAVYISDDN